jgi:hypothetical protein
MLPQRSIHLPSQGHADKSSGFSAHVMETPVGGLRKSGLNITVTKLFYPQAFIQEIP